MYIPGSDRGLSDEWITSRDRLYDAALSRAITVNGAVDSLTPSERELVTLWKLEADIQKGGFLRFFCNWGAPTFETARAALEAVGATPLNELLQEMHAIVEPYLSSIATSLRELEQLLSTKDAQRLTALERLFCEHSGNLPRLVSEYYRAA